METFAKGHENTGKHEKWIRIFGHFFVFNIAEEKPRKWVTTSPDRKEKQTVYFTIGKVERILDGEIIYFYKIIVGPFLICIGPTK